jgi:hypothetical protein
MGKTLALVTTDNKNHSYDILSVAWVNDTYASYIEIVAKSATQHTTVQIYSGSAKPDLAPQFHDKLLAVYGRIDTQITAYTNTATVSTSVDIYLDKSRVYLLV